MARALASSGLTSAIPMATSGRWLSLSTGRDSRLRDLLAIIIPMIEAPNLFDRQRSHQTGSRSELIRRLLTGTSARRWIMRGVAPIALPPLPLQSNARSRERSGKRGREEVLSILLCSPAPWYRKAQRREAPETLRVPTAQERRKPGEKMRREQI
jgi:hypothetical protein